MSTRAYDYIIQVANADSFVIGNSVIGATSLTVGELVGKTASNLKVKLSNAYQSFTIGETLLSNSSILTSYNVFSNVTSSIDGISNTFALPISEVSDDAIQVYVDGYILDPQYYTRQSANTIQFTPRDKLVSADSDQTVQYVFPDTSISSLLIQTVSGNAEAYSFISSNYTSQISTASSTISNIFNNPYIAEKNSIQQTPLVKLYTIYYPGEWYPPNANGNPSGSGDTFPWPYGFPLRYAEILGEAYSDFNYSVSLGGTEYRVISIEGGDIDIDSSGKIGELTMSISNFDGIIASLVENKNLLGYNSSSNTLAIVNGELVQNIDPRTVFNSIYYDANVAASRGTNAAWDYTTTISVGDTWVPLKKDSRDLLGAIVDIKYTYAKFLDYWPEYSIVRSSSSNTANVYSSMPYRVGDTVTSNSTSNTATVVRIDGNQITFDTDLLSGLSAGSKLLITNPDADPVSHVNYVYTLNRLDELDEFVAKFSLTNWLQYFKMKLPRRKFVNTTCPWRYRGAECKYPISGSSEIVGSNPAISANGYFTYSNEPTELVNADICSKTLTACALRHNLVNFGGFPGLEND
jgi:phage-related protein